MKKLVIAATALLISTQVIAESRELKMDFFGCIDASTYRTLEGYLSTDDKEMFEWGINARLLRGECTVLNKGEKVLVNVSLGNLVMVQRIGETSAFWTRGEAVL